MRLAIDFDGTLCEHRFPDIGREVPGAIEFLKKFKDAGAKLILWTMRSEETLQEAVDWCSKRGVTFDGVNEGPGDRHWTNSPKVYAHIYIDDAAFGCPLTESKEMGAREMVDWDVVGPKVLEALGEGQ